MLRIIIIKNNGIFLGELMSYVYFFSIKIYVLGTQNNRMDQNMLLLGSLNKCNKNIHESRTNVKKS